MKKKDPNQITIIDLIIFLQGHKAGIILLMYGTMRVSKNFFVRKNATQVKFCRLWFIHVFSKLIW